MHLKIKHSSIQCDNTSCDYKDKTREATEDMIGTPCPKCGENLLTKEDYNIYQAFLVNLEFINSLTPKELDEVAECLPDVDAAPNIKYLNITFHKELKITPIEELWYTSQQQTGSKSLKSKTRN